MWAALPGPRPLDKATRAAAKPGEQDLMFKTGNSRLSTFQKTLISYFFGKNVDNVFGENVEQVETFHHRKILGHWDPCHKFQTILAVAGIWQHKQQNEMSKPWTWILDSLSLPFDSGLLGHQLYVWHFEGGPKLDVSLILLATSQEMKPLNFVLGLGLSHGCVWITWSVKEIRD